MVDHFRSGRTLRRLGDRTTRALPAPAQMSAWRFRRAVSRARRSARERRGDFSRSHPAQFAIRAALARHLGLGEGFFVEAGANDGFFESTTYELEREFAWRGLLVEPAPELARAACLARPLAVVRCCALVAAAYPETHIELEYAGPMTRIGSVSHNARGVPLDAPPHRFRAPAKTLTALLDEIGIHTVDFLSLDVEGYEAAALMGIEPRHLPRFALIEVGEEDGRQLAVEQVLGARYEPAERPTTRDILYRRLD